MRVRLLVALLAVAVAGCAPTRNRPATWPNGWEVNSVTGHECIVTDASERCTLYAGSWKVGVLQVSIEDRFSGEEQLALTVNNLTSCSMRVGFDIRQPDAFGPQQGFVVAPVRVGPHEVTTTHVSLYWRNGIRRVYFEINPSGPISCQ